jgi:hypothetical protein
MMKQIIVKPRLLLGAACVLLVLSGCGQQDSAKPAAKNEFKTAELKTVKPLTTDASLIAAEVYQFILKAEQSIATLDPATPQQFEQQIFVPANTLLKRWRLEVKQSDSVVGDQYTICRGALVSLDAWARSVLDQSGAATAKQEVFVKQKQLCAQALSNQIVGQS